MAWPLSCLIAAEVGKKQGSRALYDIPQYGAARYYNTILFLFTRNEQRLHD